MKQYLFLYGATFLVMTVLDLLWLGGVARNFYKNRIGDLMELSLLPGILFYLLYVVGILFFTRQSMEGNWQLTFFYGAAVGLLAYGTYDLTNLATLKGWPVSLTIVDMLWGTLVTGAAAAGGRVLAEWLMARF